MPRNTICDGINHSFVPRVKPMKKNCRQFSKSVRKCKRCGESFIAPSPATKRALTMIQSRICGLCTVALLRSARIAPDDNNQ